MNKVPGLKSQVEEMIRRESEDVSAHPGNEQVVDKS